MISVIIVSLILAIVIRKVVKLILLGRKFHYHNYTKMTRWIFLLKLFSFSLLLWFRNRKKKIENRFNQLYNVDDYRYAQQMEKEHELLEDDSIDSVYFYCHGDLNSSSQTQQKSKYDKVHVILRLARRKNRVHEFWMWIVMNNSEGKEEKILVAPNFPNIEMPNSSGIGWAFPTGLRITCNRPNEHWIIRYNGWTKKPSNGESVHLDMKLNFRAFTNIIDSHKSTSSWMTADAIANEKWTKQFFEELKQFKENNQTHYEQWGAYDGYVKFDRSEDEVFQLKGAKGYRDHSFGIRNWQQYQKYCALFGHLEDGTTFSMGAVSCQKTLNHIRYGYLVTPIGDTRLLTSHSLNLPDVYFNYPPTQTYSFEFTAEGDYEAHVECLNETEFLIQNGSTLITERLVKFRINGLIGYGINEFCASTQSPPPTPSVKSYEIKQKTKQDKTSSTDFCIQLSQTNREVAKRDNCGGKGAQLAELFAMQDIISETELQIPRCFVLTTRAFTDVIKKNDRITEKLKEIKELKKLWNENEDKIWSVCEDIVGIISEIELDDKMKQDICSNMTDLFGMDWRERVKVAVRSSSVDEDGVVASSAGQMETILGVRGEQQLFHSISQCWSSLYTKTAVQYRHMNLMPIDSSIAVVIMEMIPSEVSGVLFTVNPSNEDFTTMILNCSYGLGEAIVSGKCEPDTFIIEKPMSVESVAEDEFEIVQSIKGSKKIRIDMKQDEGQAQSTGLEEKEFDETGEDTGDLSLTTQQVFKIARIGRKIEMCYGEPRDIEWAFDKEGQLFILQSRPITTLDQLKDEDLLHEFDSALSSEEEFITTCNIGEMMPMAVTPLTYSLFNRAIDRYLQSGTLLFFGVLKELVYPMRYSQSFANNLFINISNLGSRMQGHVLLGDVKNVFFLVMGQMLEKPTNIDLIRHTGISANWKRFLNLLITIKETKSGPAKTKEWENKFRIGGYKIREKSTSIEQMKVIENQLKDYMNCWYDTSINTSNGAGAAIAFENVLESLKGGSAHSSLESTNEIFGKVAISLSSCENVISADVPSAIEKLANAITYDKESLRVFKEEDKQTCLDWLMKNGPTKLKAEFQSFIDKHGNRCIREAEFREVSWRRDPMKVCEMLQTIVVNSRESKTKKKVVTVDEAIEEIAGDAGFLRKKQLKYMLKNARKGVASREWGKSLAIEMCEIFKVGFCHLSEIMYRENLLPDKDLIYFLTFEELDDLLLNHVSSKAALIQRAIRRRKILPQQMETEMPDFCFGTPVPLNSDDKLDLGDDVKKLTGFPVSPGKIKAKARVVTSLAAAKSIQQGEILIVPYTDIGWTPFFPLISGLVTEKGGLISHGAVIAREYGLPCIVSCKNACQIVKSGDTVVLDGANGSLTLSE